MFELEFKEECAKLSSLIGEGNLDGDNDICKFT